MSREPDHYHFSEPYVRSFNIIASSHSNAFLPLVPAGGEIVWQESVYHGQDASSGASGNYEPPIFPQPHTGQYPDDHGTIQYPAQSQGNSVIHASGSGSSALPAVPQSTGSTDAAPASGGVRIQTVASEALVEASHRRRKNPEKKGRYVCEMCGRDFTASHNLNNHINSHFGLKPYPCEFCNESFGTAHVLKRHVRKKHEPKTHDTAPGTQTQD